MLAFLYTAVNAVLCWGWFKVWGLDMGTLPYFMLLACFLGPIEAKIDILRDELKKSK